MINKLIINLALINKKYFSNLFFPRIKSLYSIFQVKSKYTSISLERPCRMYFGPCTKNGALKITSSVLCAIMHILLGSFETSFLFIKRFFHIHFYYKNQNQEATQIPLSEFYIGNH